MKSIKIGKVVLGRGPAIAVTVEGKEIPKSILKILRSVGARYAVPLLLELRIDRFPRIEAEDIVRRILAYRKLGLPLVATIRSPKEGGTRRLSEARRFRLFKKILPWVHAIDVELTSKSLVRKLVPLARRRGKRVILSYHHFRAAPPDDKILQRIQEGKKWGADLVKIAVTPKSNAGVARLLLLTHRNRKQRLITIAMGRRGLPSRVLAPLFGSLLTYSFVGRSQAPGQLSLPELLRAMEPFYPPRRKK